MLPDIEILSYITVSITGLIFGSFATAMIWRIPRDISWISDKDKRKATRSECPACHHKLGVLDLVPLFSWLFSRGKCRYCKGAISLRYPLVELGTMLACLLAYIVWGPVIPVLLIILAMPFLVAMFVIDCDHLILPDQLMIICAVLGLLFRVSIGFYAPDHLVPLTGLMVETNIPAWVEGLGAAILYGGLIWLVGALMKVILKKDALGFGDVKFFAVAGLWLGLAALPLFLMMGGVLGVVWGILWRFTVKDPVFPFGPALILSFYACLLLLGLGSIPLYTL